MRSAKYHLTHRRSAKTQLDPGPPQAAAQLAVEKHRSSNDPASSVRIGQHRSSERKNCQGPWGASAAPPPFPARQRLQTGTGKQQLGRHRPTGATFPGRLVEPCCLNECTGGAPSRVFRHPHASRWSPGTHGDPPSPHKTRTEFTAHHLPDVGEQVNPLLLPGGNGLQHNAQTVLDRGPHLQ